MHAQYGVDLPESMHVPLFSQMMYAHSSTISSPTVALPLLMLQPGDGIHCDVLASKTSHWPRKNDRDTLLLWPPVELCGWLINCRMMLLLPDESPNTSHPLVLLAVAFSFSDRS